MKICPSCSARQADDVLVCTSCGYAWGERQPKKTMMGIPAIFEAEDNHAEDGDDKAKHTLFGLPAIRQESQPLHEDPTAVVNPGEVAQAIQKARLSKAAPEPAPPEYGSDSTREVSANELAAALGRDRFSKPRQEPSDELPVTGPPSLESDPKRTSFGIPAAVVEEPAVDGRTPPAGEEQPKSRATMFGLPMISADNRGPQESDEEEKDSPTQTAFGAAFPQGKSDPVERDWDLDESSEIPRTEIASPAFLSQLDDDKAGYAIDRWEDDEPDEPVSQPKQTMMGMSLADMKEQALQEEQKEAPAAAPPESAAPSSLSDALSSDDKKKKLLDRVRSLRKAGEEGAAQSPVLPKPSLPRPPLPKPATQPPALASSGVVRNPRKEKRESGDDSGLGVQNGEDSGFAGLGTYKVNRGTSDSTREFPFAEVVPSVKKLRIDPALQGHGNGAGFKEPDEVAEVPVMELEGDELDLGGPVPTAFPVGGIRAGDETVEALPELALEPLDVEPLTPNSLDFGAEPANLRFGGSREIEVPPARDKGQDRGSVPAYSIHDAIDDELFDDEPAGQGVYPAPVAYPEQPWSPGGAPEPSYIPEEAAPVSMIDPSLAPPVSTAPATDSAKLTASLQKIAALLGGLLMLVGGGLALGGIERGSVIGFVSVTLPMVAALATFVFSFLKMGAGIRTGALAFIALIGLGGFAGATMAAVSGIGPFVLFGGALLVCFATAAGLMTKFIK